ncbi:MAG: PD40 domain-containing protein [Bacteroidales bacterium]|nr:PD40 domain-containing protein [Bacteroidales bacterium]
MNKSFYTFFVTFLILFVYSSNTKAQGLSEAMEAYENLQYDIAVKSFEKAWKKDPSNIEINYYFGKCILRADVDRTEAIKYLEAVIGADVNYKDASLELGKAYMYKRDFVKAQQVLNHFLKNYDFDDDDDGDDSKTNYKREAETLLLQIESAKKVLADTLNVSFINLGPEINSKRSEFAPFIGSDGQTLFFTSNKKYDGDLMELIKNGYYSNFSTSENPEWEKPKSMGRNVNSFENEMIVGLSKDESKVIVSVTWMDDKSDLFITSKEGKKYQELDELEKTVNSEFNEPAGSLSKSEDTLYFASNRPGGFGGFDIYIAVKLPDGTWGKPLNMGSEINTEFNETFPIISEDSQSLNFSSDRPESMGGYDIFTAYKKNGKCSGVQNAGYPINDAYDNYEISYSKSKRYAYASKVRPEGLGGRDIYLLVFNDIPAQNVIYTGTIMKQNGADKSLIDSDIKISAYDNTNNKKFASSSYSKNGKYTFAFPPGEYKIVVEGSSFQKFEKIVRIAQNEPTQEIINYNIIVN